LSRGSIEAFPWEGCFGDLPLGEEGASAPEIDKETVAFFRTGHFDREVSAVDGVGGLAGLWFRP
jgi:hypothetical protein